MTTGANGRQVSRRQLLQAGAAMLVAGAATGAGASQPANAAPPASDIVKVLVHDEPQDLAVFGRGQGAGPGLQAEGLSGGGAFTSDAIQAPFPFTHAGLHWRSSGEVTAEVRTSLDGAAWTAWVTPHIEATPDLTPSGETYAGLVSAPRHLYLQYRFTLVGSAKVRSATVTFLNSADGPTSQSLSAAVSLPGAIDFTREQWGCDESLRFRSGREIWKRMYVPVKKLTVHHTASGAYTDGAAEVRAIYTYHAKTLGWGDIGYNALVDKDGNSYEGRYGRGSGSAREIFSSDVVAGHASGHNYGTCGVAAIGNFETDPVWEPMRARLLDVLQSIATARQVDPLVRSSFLQSGGAFTPNLFNVFAHRDCNATACPGANLYAQMDALRGELASRLSLPAAPVFTAGPDGVSVAGSSLSYAWVNQPGLQYSLEGWSKSVSSEDIKYLKGFTSDRSPQWNDAGSSSGRTFSSLSEGHYTLHLRAWNGSVYTYEGNRTVLLRRR